MKKKLISVVTPCYNEEGNVEALANEIKDIFYTHLKNYDYEHIFIDNCSKDSTVDILKNLSKNNYNLKIIVNSKNFGHIRSPFYAMKLAQGDAVISLVSDFQDPPQLILEFIKKWEEGYKIVLGVKNESYESPIFFTIRKFYYYLASKLADIELVKNFTGFGLYDKAVMDNIRKIEDPYPYWRGLICEMGFEKFLIPFKQPKRKRGITKNNFYTLYDMAMLGITTHSKIPLRLCTMMGFAFSAISFIIGCFYLGIKIIHWSQMSLGVAPLVIGLFFFGSVQLFFIGILGEYIGNIHTQILKRPLVIEKERINF